VSPRELTEAALRKLLSDLEPDIQLIGEIALSVSTAGGPSQDANPSHS
jgi:hypothetical protein